MIIYLNFQEWFQSRVSLCNVVTCNETYSGTKLSSKLQLKSQSKKDHQHDVVYYAKYPEVQCTEDYTGKKRRCLINVWKITVAKI